MLIKKKKKKKTPKKKKKPNTFFFFLCLQGMFICLRDSFKIKYKVNMEDLSRHDLKLLSSPTSRVFQL